MNFNKINNKILEKYPSIWNTKIVWMSSIGIIIHIIYFILGYFRFVNPVTFRMYSYFSGIDREFFQPLTVIISILLLVIWLINLFKNNAFKSYYPQSKGQLFKQYLQYIYIIFITISFPLSYSLGYKIYLNYTYTDSDITTNWDDYSKAKLFALTNTHEYLPQNRYYPPPFDSVIPITTMDKMDINKPILTFDGNKLQYFKAKYDKVINMHSSIAVSERISKAYDTYTEDSITHLIELGEYINLDSLVINNYSLYNFSYDQATSNNYKHYNNYYNYKNKANKIAYSKYVNDLLQRNNPQEFKQIINNIINIGKKYKINYNITTEKWFELVYHPPYYILDSFLREPKKHEYYNGPAYSTERIIEPNTEGDSIESYYAQRITKENLFFDFNAIETSLNAITSLKNCEILHLSFLVYLCISIGLSHILLAFRVSNGKLLLLAIISALVLSLITALVAIGMLISNNVLPFLYFILLEALTIIGIAMNSRYINSKNISGIAIALSSGLLPYLWILIRAIIHEHELLYLKIKYAENYYKHTTSIDMLGYWNVYIIIILNLLGTYVWLTVIRRWKARPEI
jgi:hypothetical protein